MTYNISDPDMVTILWALRYYENNVVKPEMKPNVANLYHSLVTEYCAQHDV